MKIMRMRMRCAFVFFELIYEAAVNLHIKVYSIYGTYNT